MIPLKRDGFFFRAVQFFSPRHVSGERRLGRTHGCSQKTVLMAWELGRGLGHINRLLTVAKYLIADGHRVVCAFRSNAGIDTLSNLIPSADIFQAPYFQRTIEHPPRPEGYVYNYADLLHRCGYAGFSDLDRLVQKWHELFSRVQPDFIVCDHSPTAVLAASDRVPVLHLGSGFTNPPAGKPLLTLCAKAEPGAAEREAQVLDVMARVRRKLGSAELSRVSDLFATGESLACCLPLLDPYRTTRDQPAIGPVQGLPDPLAPGGRALVFGYLAADDVRVKPMLKRLIKATVPICLYIRQAPPAWFEMTEGTSVKLFDIPQKLPDALIAASAVLHHGGLSTAEMALASGRPQFLLPRYLEQQLTAGTLEEVCCGVNLARSGVDPISEIQKALKRPVLRKSAEAMALKTASEHRRPAGDLIMERCRYHLSR